MISAISSVKQGLAHATFKNSDIEKATKELLETLSADLTEAGYEPGDDVTKVESKLVSALDEADEQNEALSELEDAAAEGASLEDEETE